MTAGLFLFGQVETFIHDPEFYGRMNDPDGAALLRGPCGDVMEFYVAVAGGRLTAARYYTEGCHATRACGAVTARLVSGKTVQDALGVSAGEVMSRLQDLPEDHRHCAILAVSAFYRAVADFLLKS